jgi:hypothetical protein
MGGFDPGAYARGFMLTPAPQAQTIRRVLSRLELQNRTNRKPDPFTPKRFYSETTLILTIHDPPASRYHPCFRGLKSIMIKPTGES